MEFLKGISTYKLLVYFGYQELARSDIYVQFKRRSHEVLMYLSKETKQQLFYDNYGNSGTSEDLYLLITNTLNITDDLKAQIVDLTKEIPEIEVELQPTSGPKLKSFIASFFLPKEEGIRYKFLNHALFRGKVFTDAEGENLRTPLFKLPGQSANIELSNIIESNSFNYEMLLESNGYNDFNFSKENVKSLCVFFNPEAIENYYTNFKDTLKDTYCVLLSKKFSMELLMLLEDLKVDTNVEEITFIHSGSGELEQILNYIMAYTNSYSKDYRLVMQMEETYIDLFMEFEGDSGPNILLSGVSKVIKAYKLFMEENYLEFISDDIKSNDGFNRLNTLNKILFTKKVGTKKLAKICFPKKEESMEFLATHFINELDLKMTVTKI